MKSKQGYKRDPFFQDLDETFPDFPKTETFNFGFETRPRPFEIQTETLSRCRKRYSLLSFWLQTATNYAVFRPFIMQNTVQYQQLFYRNLCAIFPKTVSIHALCTDYLITIFSKIKS